MKVKIAHCADLHIGSKISGLGHKAVTRAAEVKNSFFNIINVCDKENIDVLCISGDFFDDVSVLKGEIDEIKGICESANFKIVISPGNHDPFSADSPYKDIWPENVFIFKNNYLEKIEFDDIKVRVWGAAFKGRYENKSFLKNIEMPKDDFINLGVLHGEIVSSNLCKSSYNPVLIEDIEKSGFDYLALGHIHKRSKIYKSGETFYSYSGNVESSGFNDLGEKGIYLGEISKGFCDLKFIKTCKRSYYIKEINVSGLKNDNDIAEKISSSLAEEFGENYDENIYKIVLIGEISDGVLINTQDIKSILESGIFYCNVEDNTEIEIDTENFNHKNDFKGIFIKKMAEKINNQSSEDDKLIYKKALKLGLISFESDVKYNDDN